MLAPFNQRVEQRAGNALALGGWCDAQIVDIEMRWFVGLKVDNAAYLAHNNVIDHSDEHFVRWLA